MAAQRASLELEFVLAPLTAGAPTKRSFYEVTFVQFLFQYLLTDRVVGSEFEVYWEVSYLPSKKAPGHPYQVDMELVPKIGSTKDMFAIEVGQFTKAKVEKDAAKLITVFPSAKPSTRVLVVYWYLIAPQDLRVGRKCCG